MAESAKKIAKKSAIIFIATMVFFTFSSKTIHYYMMPKVTATRVESGYIRYNVPISDIDFYDVSEIEIKIPSKLDRSFVIGEIAVEEGARVEEGDTLITFEKSSYNEIIKEKEKEIENLKIELLEFKKSFNQRIEQLEKEMADLNSQITLYQQEIDTGCFNTDEVRSRTEQLEKLKLQQKEKETELEKIKKQYELDLVTYQEVERAEKDLESLKMQIGSQYEENERIRLKLIEDYSNRKKEAEYKLDQLSRELNYIKETGILNGKTEVIVKNKLDEAMAELEFLQEYPVLKAPASGIIKKIYYKETDYYDGVKPLMVIKLENESKRLIASLSGKYQTGDYSKIIKPEAPCELRYGNNTLNGVIAESLVKDGKNQVVISFEGKEVSEIKLPENNEPVSMEIRGDYCDILVPNSAFKTPEELYVLRSRQGFWGQEYYVVLQKVSPGESNEYYTHVINGLSRSDMVITGWDRELKDGITVTLPIE